MNMNRIINMVINTIIMQIVRRGVSFGMDRFAGPKKKPSEMTDAEKREHQMMQKTSETMRVGGRNIRRRH